MALLSSVSLLLLPVVAFAQQYPLADLVRTDTGSINGGNTFPGVSRPLGIVKLGPDVFHEGWDSYSGYQADGNFTGFSMLHESGTGGAPKYGVVSQMPVVGHVENPLSVQDGGRASPDVMEVGYYRSSLAVGIDVELAATHKAGIYKYRFPEGQKAGVIVDVSHVLPSYRGQGLEQHYLGGEITVHNEGKTPSYQGYGDYDNGWNRARRWRVYFCGYFDKPATFKTFLGTDMASEGLAQYSDAEKVTSFTARLGAIFSFQEAETTSRVGVSFISSEQACRNVKEEIPKGTELEKVRDDTKRDWEERVLSKVTTTDDDPEKASQLYTALYFMNLLPTNKTGENPGWKSDEPYYDDIFTFWDTFRCTTSLFHILQPNAYEEFIRSWIDIWRHEGFMSDARSSFYNGAVQAGSNVDNVFADAYVKGVRGKINWQDGYEAMRTNAEETPPNNDDGRDPSGSTKEGRGALPDWLDYGFITPRFTRSVTRAVEYSVNDFALHQVARGLGKSADAQKYLVRSRNWRNHWNPGAEALGQWGFMVPRDENGFIEQDPLSCGGCYWGDYYYQGLPWEYSFNTHHDLATLVVWTGGEEWFLNRLELTFEPGMFGGNEGFGNTIFNPGNEPSFGTPYLYNFINRQYLSVKRSRFIAKSYYHPTPDGLPGNSDAGAMESWLLWNMIGMYPMTGQTTFLIGSPWFDNLVIHLGDGKKLEISATGRAEESFYVQSLKVNGKPWDRNWVTWKDIFQDGGSLHFELGPEPVAWDTGHVPPSPGWEGYTPPEEASVVFGGETAVAVIAGGSGLLTTLAVVIMMFLRRKEKAGSDGEEQRRRHNRAASDAVTTRTLLRRSIDKRALWSPLSPALGKVFGWKYPEAEYRDIDTESSGSSQSGSSNASDIEATPATPPIQVRGE